MENRRWSFIDLPSTISSGLYQRNASGLSLSGPSYWIVLISGKALIVKNSGQWGKLANASRQYRTPSDLGQARLRIVNRLSDRGCRQGAARSRLTVCDRAG